MSRTKKGKKPIGYDYWGKRPIGSGSSGTSNKRDGIQKERAALKRETQKKTKSEV
jgi:hypothetical protein